MRHRGQRAGEEQAQAATGSSEDARPAQNSGYAKYKKRADNGEQFGLLEGYEAGNQDPRGDGSQRTEQRVLHERRL
jgi:hypothetical protein